MLYRAQRPHTRYRVVSCRYNTGDARKFRSKGAVIWRTLRGGRGRYPVGRIPRDESRNAGRLWLRSEAARRHGVRQQGEGILMRLSNESLLVILFVGLIAGWLAGKIVRGTGFGIIGDILVGIAGAFISSWLFPRLGLHLGAGLVSEIIYSALGAIILLLIV